MKPPSQTKETSDKAEDIQVDVPRGKSSYADAYRVKIGEQKLRRPYYRGRKNDDYEGLDEELIRKRITATRALLAQIKLAPHFRPLFKHMLYIALENPTLTVSQLQAKLSIIRAPTTLPPNEIDLPPTDDFSLPKKAPALWRGQNVEQMTPPEFVVKHYQRWMGKGLLREHVVSLDPELGKALENFFYTHKGGKKVTPEAFYLPTRKQANDSWVSHVLESRGSDALTEEAVKEAARRATAAHRQLQKGQGTLTEDQVRQLRREASALRRRWDKEQASIQK